MSNKLLDIEPLDIQFPFELEKKISCTQYLTNKTDDYVAFKVKTTNPKKYTVRPRIGVVRPRSSIEVVVTMQAQKKVPADMQCKDKFLFRSFVASPGTNAREVTCEMFNEQAGNRVEETKLKVIYVDHRPRPVFEGSLPKAFVSDKGNVSNKLLDIEPLDLQFHLEWKEQITCTQYLTNKTDNNVAFKVKTTNPKNCIAKPNIGVILPRSSIEVVVTMREQKEVPANMKCKDKFLFQCFVASPGTNATEVTHEMFNKEAGNQIEQTKLKFVYVDHPALPLHKASLPKASVSDNRNHSVSALVTRLTEEKDSAVQLNKKLQQELDQLKHGSDKSRGCGILIHIKWFASARGLRRKTVKEGEVSIQI